VAAGLPLDVSRELPQLLCFPTGPEGEWQLHHAAPFAVVRWTNIHDPARWVFQGDIVSRTAGDTFGGGIIDVDLRKLGGQSSRFTHTRYWELGRGDEAHIQELRRALDLTYSQL
jgi:hypothetical protein